MLELIRLSLTDALVLVGVAYGLGIAAGFGLRLEEDPSSLKGIFWPVIVAVDFYTWVARTVAKWLVDEPRCNCSYPGFVDYLGPPCPVHPAEYE